MPVRIGVYGGFCKVKLKKETEKGLTHTDMFLLSPDKHDQTFRWATCMGNYQYTSDSSRNRRPIAIDDIISIFYVS